MKNAQILCLLFGSLFSVLSAAEPPPRTFRVVSLGGDQTELLYDSGRQTGRRVTTYQSRFSKEYPAPSGTTLSFYRMVDPPAGAPPDARPTKEILAEVAYPKDVERAILLLFPGAPGAPLPLAGYVVDTRGDDHKPGMARVLNLSSLRVAFAAPDELVQTPPRSTQTIVPFTAGSCRVKVAAEAGGWKEVMDIQRNLSPNLRLYVLLFDAPAIEEGPPVACRLFHDFVRPPTTFKKSDTPSPAGGS